MKASIRSQCACQTGSTSMHRSLRPGVRSMHQASRQRRRLQQLQAAGGPGSAPTLSDGNGRNAQSMIQDSDFAFVAKLVALSVVGGLAIKYGSLLISLPFEPNAAAALSVVLGTPAAYSLYLLTLSGKQQ